MKVEEVIRKQDQGDGGESRCRGEGQLKLNMSKLAVRKPAVL